MRTNGLPVEELARFSPRYDFSFNGISATGVAAWGICLTSTPANKYTDFYPNDYSYIGNDVPHNNMEPYSVVYVFTRTA